MSARSRLWRGEDVGRRGVAHRAARVPGPVMVGSRTTTRAVALSLQCGAVAEVGSMVAPGYRWVDHDGYHLAHYSLAQRRNTIIF